MTLNNIKNLSNKDLLDLYEIFVKDQIFLGRGGQRIREILFNEGEFYDKYKTSEKTKSLLKNKITLDDLKNVILERLEK